MAAEVEIIRSRLSLNSVQISEAVIQRALRFSPTSVLDSDDFDFLRAMWLCLQALAASWWRVLLVWVLAIDRNFYMEVEIGQRPLNSSEGMAPYPLAFGCKTVQAYCSMFSPQISTEGA